MYDSSASFTLGMVVMALFISIFLLIFGDNGMDKVYNDCQVHGRHIFDDSRIIKCEVK